MTPPDMVTDREIAKWRRDGSNWKASRTNRLLADRDELWAFVTLVAGDYVQPTAEQVLPIMQRDARRLLERKEARRE